ncbi:MAG: RluA family pseudouridine synthase [Phycisphaerales bacterium]
MGLIEVVRSDARFVVISKPAGLLSVPGKGAENAVCAASWARERYIEARGPITVHRLDMDTSGLLLMALDEAAQRGLSWQFEARTVGKEYVALVEGDVAGDEGVVVAAMRLDPARRPLQVIDPLLGRPAETRWRVLSREGGRTRVRLTPLTGRSHQLRVHCASMGHPILGDGLYGRLETAPRLMLHASGLAFDDPSTGARVECVSPAPF